MRGTWQGGGTWQSGGGGGQVVLYAAAAVAVIGAAEWVAARIWWVLGGTLVLGALAVAAVLALKSWSDRRAAAVFAAREPLRIAAERVTEVPRAERPAIENHYHVHYHAADGQQAAAITRREMTMGLKIGKNKGHVNTATGRNKREVGQMAKRSARAAGGGSFTVAAPRRQNGRIAESRARFRRRQRTGVDL